MSGSEFHSCGVTIGENSDCPFMTKNKNKMRVHLRTKHKVYYCEYCRERWSSEQKQMWKRHDCRSFYSKK